MMSQIDSLAQSYCQAAMNMVAQLQLANPYPIQSRLADLYDTKTTAKDPQRIGRGIYAIYEGDRLMYIGRTNKGGIRQRISMHLDSSGTAGGATLTKKLTPSGKLDDPKFKEAAARVSKMNIRFVECRDANIQAIAETLAIAILNPSYSNNETS